MGEAKKREVAVRQQVVEALGLQTAGGQIKVRWDANRQVTTQGQMESPSQLVPNGWKPSLEQVQTSIEDERKTAGQKGQR